MIAVEVRQGTSSQLGAWRTRRGEEEEEEEEAEEKTTHIKSNNPHPTGGKKVFEFSEACPMCLQL